MRVDVLAAQSARGLHEHCPSQEKREQGKPGARSTRSPCATKMHTVVTTVAPEIIRLSPRNGFNGFLRALPGDEFLLSPSPRRLTICLSPVGPTKSPQGLASATDARTTRLRRTQRPPPIHRRTMCCPPSFGRGVEAPFVCALLFTHGNRPANKLARQRCRVHRIPSRVRDDSRSAPLAGKGRAELVELIGPSGAVFSPPSPCSSRGRDEQSSL
jgi:hypothetical protein